MKIDLKLSLFDLLVSGELLEWNFRSIFPNLELAAKAKFMLSEWLPASLHGILWKINT